MSAPSSRVQWADAAKGACIVLVVLLHVTTKHYLQLGRIDRDVRDAWIAVSEWLRPVRMPLFFVISGFFARSSLQRGLRPSLLTRVAQPLYLYVIWLSIQTLAVDRWLRPYVDSTSPGGFVRALLMPTGNLWYLWALAVFFVVSATVPSRARPALLAVATVAAVAVTAGWIDLAPRPTDIVHFSAFYLAGTVVPLGALVHALRGRTAVMAVAGFAAATWAVRHGDLSGHAFVAPALGALGVIAGLATVRSVRGRLADGLSTLGRQTLPIYVMHVPVLMVWSWFVRRDGWRGGSPWEPAMWFYPLVLTAGVVAVTLALHTLARRLGLWFVFSLTRPRRTTPPDPSPTRSARREREAEHSTGGTGS